MTPLPNDIFIATLPYLDSVEFFNLTGTCKALRLDLRVQAKIDEIKKRIDQFIFEYGAIANCEGRISIKDLRGKIENICNDNWEEYKSSFHDIAGEFFKAELDLVSPLQDIRDKCKRLITINKMHTTLAKESSYEYSFQKFTHTPFSSQYDLVQKWECPKNFANLSNFVEKKYTILGETTLNLNKRQVACEIIGSLRLNDDRNDLSRETVISLVQQPNCYLLGSLTFSKYDQGKLYTKVNISTFRGFNILTEAEVENRISVMESIIQIAVEIFMRESETLLILGNVGRYPTVAAGFSFFYKDFTKLDKLKNKIQEAREIGVSYPCFNEDLENFKMHKTDSLEFGTRFVNKMKKDEKQVIVGPALVDFQMGCEPITWEEKIKKNPLITVREGAILPVF